MKSKRIEPQVGQESVWDYPRPPEVEPSTKRIRVVFNGVTIANSSHAKRVLETSHPPVYYIPPNDIAMDFLQASTKTSYCEFKGRAQYWTIEVNGKKVGDAAWGYPEPTARFESIRDHIAVYPSLMDACFIGDEQVTAQAGDFYGGWISKDIVGPFKGGKGTWGW